MLGFLPEKMRTLLRHRGVVRYSKNVSWMLLEKVIRILLGITLGVWVIRYLGPQDVGDLSYVQSLVGLFSPLIFLGLDGLLIRELVEQASWEDRLMGTVFTVSAISSVVAVVLVVVLSLFGGEWDGTTTLTFIIAASFLFKSLLVTNLYFQSKALSVYIVISNMIGVGIGYVLRVFFILGKFPLIFFAMVILLDEILRNFCYLFFYIREGGRPGRWRFDVELAKNMLLKGWPYVLSGLVIVFYSKIDQVMLKKMVDSVAVGHYAAAARVSESCYFIPSIIVGSLFPAILNAKINSREKYLFRVQRLYDFILVFSLGIILPIVFFSEEIVSFLYGIKFALSAKVLAVHILCTFLIGIGVVRERWILSENLQYYELFIHLFGAASNVIFNFFLIGRYGVLGAAYGTLMAHVFTFFVTALLIRPIRPSFFMALKSFSNILTLKFLRRGYFRVWS